MQLPLLGFIICITATALAIKSENFVYSRISPGLSIYTVKIYESYFCNDKELYKRQLKSAMYIDSKDILKHTWPLLYRDQFTIFELVIFFPKGYICEELNIVNEQNQIKLC